MRQKEELDLQRGQKLDDTVESLSNYIMSYQATVFEGQAVLHKAVDEAGVSLKEVSPSSFL